jgi:hypothetical protein
MTRSKLAHFVRYTRVADSPGPNLAKVLTFSAMQGQSSILIERRSIAVNRADYSQCL